MRNFWQKIKALFTKSDVEKTSLQKTARISIIFAAIAIVGVIVYFAVVAPLLSEENTQPPELFEGEVYQNGAIYILPQYERTQIKSIEIKNDEDHYKLNAYKSESGDTLFEIEGSEEIDVDAEALSALLAAVRILITNSPAGQDRVLATATEEDLAHYGLDKASEPSWFEVTLTDDTSYRIYIGNSLVTTTGYYVILDGRKNTVTDENGITTEYDIVYALQSGLANTVLQNSATIVSKTLLPSVGNDIYNASEFLLTRLGSNGEKKAIVRIGLADDPGISAASQTYQMIYPQAYVINEDNYLSVLSTLSSKSAEAIVAYGDAIYDSEVYEKYGLDLDPDRLNEFTDKNHGFLYFNCSDTSAVDYEEYAQMLYFSESFTDLDGVDYYYVYSPAYSVIGKVLASDFEYMEWKLAKFTNPYLYYEYFTSAEEIEIVSEREKLDHVFTITGKERSRHVDVTDSAGKIIYRVTDSGATIPLVYETMYTANAIGGVNYYGEFETFRNFYYILITRQLALSAEIDENETTIGNEIVATLRVTTAAKDHPTSYYMYDANGQKSDSTIRDEGGNILCHKVIVPTTLSDGTVKEITYDKAYYDVEAGRFFLKQIDSNDGNEKPSGYKDSGNGTVKVTTFLPKTAYGEYEETIYSYEFYDLFDYYNGTKQLNPTYMYVIPTTTVNTYRITADGEKELVSSTTNRAEAGVYIRTATIDKLFSDAHNLIDGKEIDTMGVN